ncbi:MAG TPA: M1 family aminopeptidase [Candidatus Cloacimonadota bacterium]|nr:M1 family aminopeptidase [Candidatus Cloacimonadota bacterium]
MRKEFGIIFILAVGLFLLTCVNPLLGTQPYWSTLPSLQQTERHDSLTGFDITKYILTLSVNDQTHYISGNVLTFVTAENNLTGIDYNLTGGTLLVTQVLVNNSVSAFTFAEGIIHIPLNFTAGEAFTTQVFYSGTPGLSPAPYNIGLKFNANSFYTLSNPDAGRYWWPCYDHPWDKALIELYITVRNDWLVAGNGTRQSIIDNGDGTKTHHWTMQSPVATYLVGIAAGPFTEFNQQAGNLPIQNFVLPTNLAHAQIDFSNLPEMISYFSSLYGPYPFEKYGHACVTISPYAAMEHQTMTTFGAQYLTGDLVNEPTVAHELTHQWFGNSVTPLTMQDVWLKESFATYAEFLWKAHHYGWNAGLSYLASSIQNYYLSWENSNGPHTIYNPAYNELFAPPTYQKSASVLHMLRLKMGNANFFNFMQTWLNIYCNGNVITEEIQQTAEQASGLNLDQFFRQWIYGSGIPSAKLNYFTDLSGHAKIIAQTFSPTATQFELEIPLRYEFSLQDSIVVYATPEGCVNNLSLMDASFENMSNIQIDPDHWVLNRGFSVNNFQLTLCAPANHSVTLRWTALECPVPFAGYLVWRKQLPEGEWTQINPLPVSDLTYTDNAVNNGITYQYRITACDAQNFLSLPTDAMSATPVDFPFDWGFLVVDETRDGSGLILSPTDQMVDDFYSSVLAGMPYSQWDYAALGAPSLSTLSHYPLLLWHCDDFSEFYLDDNITVLSSYLISGGKLVVSGWKYPSALPQTFFDQWFAGVVPRLLSSPVLISARSDIYPTLFPDPSKLPPIWNNCLGMTYIFPGASQVLYYAETTDSLNGYGEPLAVRTDNNGTCILLGFPLYYMQQEGVVSFLHQLLPELYPPVSVQDENAVPQCFTVNCYPNPFAENLNIRLTDKTASSYLLTVYNLKGRQVWQTHLQHTKEAIWNGKNNAGENLPSGIYLLRISSGKEKRMIKVTLLR